MPNVRKAPSKNRFIRNIWPAWIFTRCRRLHWKLKDLGRWEVYGHRFYRKGKSLSRGTGQLYRCQNFHSLNALIHLSSFHSSCFFLSFGLEISFFYYIFPSLFGKKKENFRFGFVFEMILPIANIEPGLAERWGFISKKGFYSGSFAREEKNLRFVLFWRECCQYWAKSFNDKRLIWKKECGSNLFAP